MAQKFKNQIDAQEGIKITNELYDGSNAAGNSGQVLSSTGSATQWIDFNADSAKRLEVTVKNVSGASLAKGVVVHAAPTATPPSGNVIEVIAADANVASSMPAIGVLNETIADETEGLAVMFGTVSGIDTSSFSIGDELYVSETAGEFTATKPTAYTSQVQKIAVVIKSHASNGLIKVFGAGRTNDVPNRIDRNVNFTDGSKLEFGTDSDLEIYHDGSHSFIDTQNNTSGQRQSKFDSLIIKTDYNGGDGQPYSGFGGGLVFNNETYSGTFYDSAAIYSGIGDDSVATTEGGHLAFYTSSTKTSAPTEKMHIDSSGNVGIGLTPNASYSKLQVKTPASSYGLDLVGRDAGSNSESQITFWNAAQTTVQSAIGNVGQSLHLYVAGDDRLVIDSSGNVGVNIDPVSKFHIKYSGGDYTADSTSGFINEATTGRGTQRIRSITDSPAELFFDIDGGVSWDISARDSSASNGLYFFSRAATPAYNAVGSAVVVFGQNGDITSTGNGIFSGRLELNDGVTMTGGWRRTALLTSVYPVIVFKSTADGVSYDPSSAGIGYDSSFGTRFWKAATSNDVSGTGTNWMSVPNSGTIEINQDTKITTSNFYVGADTATVAYLRIGGANAAGGRIWLEYNGDSSYIDCYGGHGSTERYRDLAINARSLTLKTGTTLTNTLELFENGNVKVSDGALIVNTTQDSQLFLTSADTWCGISFNDNNTINENIFYNGINGTFAIGGGGSNVAGKKLHIDGGVTIGSSYDQTAVATNSLNVEGSITSAGTVTASVLDTTGYIRIFDSGTQAGGIFKEKTITGSGTSNDISFFAESITDGGEIHFMTGGSATKRLTIDGSGYIGIGGSPVNQRKLSIYNSAGDNELEFIGTDYTNIYSQTTSTMAVEVIGSGGALRLATTGGDITINNNNDAIFTGLNVGINVSDLTAGGFSPKFALKQTANSQWGGINIEAQDDDSILALGSVGGRHKIAGSYRSSAGYKPLDINIGGQQVATFTTSSVGIKTDTPQQVLDVYLGTGNNQKVSFGGSYGSGYYQGIHFGYFEKGNLNYRKSAIVFERTDLTEGNAQGKVHLLNGPQTGAGSATIADAAISISEYRHVGINSASPISPLHLKYSGGSYGSAATSGFINQADTGRSTTRLRTIGDDASELFFDVNGAIRWDISARPSSQGYDLNFYPQAATPVYNGVSNNILALKQNGNVFFRYRAGFNSESPDAYVHVNLGAGGSNGTDGIRVNGLSDYPSLGLGISGNYHGMIRTYGNDLEMYAGHWRTIGNVSSENHSIRFYTSKSGSSNWSTAKMTLDHYGMLEVNGATILTGGWGETIRVKETYPGYTFNSNNSKWAGIFYDYSWGMRIRVAATTSDVTNSGIWALNISNAGDIRIGDSTNPSYKLDVAGSIRATSDVIAFSDKRVKENIVTINSALEKVTQLRGVTYTRKDTDDKSTKVGVIAQEVLEVLPEVVEKDDEGMYSVAYGNMAGVFIEAIKELKAEVDSLKEQLKSR